MKSEILGLAFGEIQSIALEMAEDDPAGSRDILTLALAATIYDNGLSIEESVGELIRAYEIAVKVTPNHRQQ